jgi:hypothetical protein
MESATTDRRPAYVRSLDADRRQARAELAAVLDGLNDLRAYLNSPKFRGSSDLRMGYVNVDDVLLRLNEATYAGVVAYDRALDRKENG